ncbi:glycosyltransferase family 4 protein [Patescibacteria group bacterium]|nr:glycosyltransferase family 4 protein [Patescibacteria group bacterium]
MRAAIYNPYLDTLGGGERYSMAFATVLAKKGYRVDVEWKSKAIKGKLEERFGLKLEGINIVKDVKRGDGYDICFWVSDGSIPLLRARKNFLHFQFPFQNVNGKTLLNKMKLFRINKFICNSFFTKGYIDKEYGVDSVVVYPPVDVEMLKPKKKENLIIFIGRFSQLTQAKRQDVLVRVFKKFYDRGFKNWKMVLAGGVEVGVDKYLEKLKKLAKNYPIKILESPSFAQIQNLYGKAKIFWSASGYGVSEIKEPKKVEHFGIAVVEAMAAGAVPFAFSAGGHKEIIAEGQNGFLWKSNQTLVNSTKRLIQERGLMTKISKKAREDSKIYEYKRFKTHFLELL